MSLEIRKREREILAAAWDGFALLSSSSQVIRLHIWVTRRLGNNKSEVVGHVSRWNESKGELVSQRVSVRYLCLLPPGGSAVNSRHRKNPDNSRTSWCTAWLSDLLSHMHSPWHDVNSWDRPDQEQTRSVFYCHTRTRYQSSTTITHTQCKKHTEVQLRSCKYCGQTLQNVSRALGIVSDRSDCNVTKITFSKCSELFC